MRLPSFKRLNKNDYEQQYQKLIDTLSVSLNIGLEALYEAVNNGLTLKENIDGTVRSVTVKVDSNGIPLTKASFILDVPGRIEGCQVIKAENTTNTSVYPTSAPFISYVQQGNSVLINHITGLQANQTYVLKIVAYNAPN